MLQQFSTRQFIVCRKLDKETSVMSTSLTTGFFSSSFVVVVPSHFRSFFCHCCQLPLLFTHRPRKIALGLFWSQMQKDRERSRETRSELNSHEWMANLIRREMNAVSGKALSQVYLDALTIAGWTRMRRHNDTARNERERGHCNLHTMDTLECW